MGLGAGPAAKKQAAEAERLLSGHLKRHPDDRYARQLRAASYCQLGRLDEAQAELAKSAGFEPGWRDAWDDEVLQMALGFVRLLEEAKRRLNAGDLKVATTILRKLREQRPKHVLVVNALAVALMRSQNLSEAKSVLDDAVQLDPRDYMVQMNLASYYEQKNDNRRALQHLDAAIAQNPGFADAHRSRGAILVKLNQLEEALKSYQRALELDDRDSKALFFVGVLHCELHNWEKAVRVLERAVKRDPDRAETFVALGLARSHVGQLENAEKSLIKARHLDPRAPNLEAAWTRLRRLQRPRKSQ